MARGHEKKGSKAISFPMVISVQIGTQTALGILTDKNKDGKAYTDKTGKTFLFARLNPVVLENGLTLTRTQLIAYLQ